MKIVLTDPIKVQTLVDVFRNLKSIVPIINLQLSTKKIYLQGMDDSHVCLVEVLLHSEWFDEYDVTDMVLGINCDILFKIINCWSEGYNITLSTHAEDSLEIDFTGEKMLTKQYSMPLMDLNTDTLNVPNSEYDVDLLLSSSELKDIISELSIFNDKLEISCSCENVIFKARGDDGTAVIKIKDEDIIEYSVAVEEGNSINLSIGLKNMVHGCGFHKINKEVSLHIHDDKPFKLVYKIGGREDSYVRLFIAPNIKED